MIQKPFWGYICTDCAEGKFNASWPKGHVSTSHVGTCNECGLEKVVCHTRNWRFPPGTKYRELK